MTENVDDLRLPPAVVSKIMKESLPPGTMVSKDARIAVTRAAAVFVLNITTYANDHANSRKRKMVNAEDVLHAVGVLECDQLQKPLKEAVELWQNKKSEKLADRRKKRADKKNAANTSAAEEEADAEDVNEETATQETEERQQTSQDSPSKRLSREESTSVADAPDIEDS